MKRFKVTVKSIRSNIVGTGFVNGINAAMAHEKARKTVCPKYCERVGVDVCHVDKVEDVSGQSLFNKEEVEKFIKRHELARNFEGI